MGAPQSRQPAPARPHRPLPRAAAPLLALLALLLLAFAGPAGAAKQPPSYWGAWLGPQLTGKEAPWDMTAVEKFERRAGKPLSLIQFSSPFAECEGRDCDPFTFPTDEMEKIRDYGAIPFFSWGSATPAGGPRAPAFQLADIAAGRQDATIRQFAAGARDWGHPFFLRFDWEMNGDWFPWGAGVNGNRPGEFVAAWRHVHDLFRRLGATNVTWVWCPYARSEPLRRYYPGDRYVDWTCLDGFNWGPNSPEPAPFRSFRGIFDNAYQQVARRIAPRKPMVLAELATNGSARAKARWIKGMFSTLRARFRKVRALIWFDKADRGVRWPLEGTPAAMSAFRQGIRGGFRPNVFGELGGGPIKPPR